MCMDETKKTYMVLEAFERAGRNKFLSFEEIIESVRMIGASDQERLGKSSTSAGLSLMIDELFLNSSIEHTHGKGFSITDRGRAQRDRLKRYVYPERSPLALS